jgi:lysophospholipase L1-like esterase
MLDRVLSSTCKHREEVIVVKHKITVLSLALIASASSTLAQNSNNVIKGPYLALGDSITFGYNPYVTQGDLNKYHGYPQFVSFAIQEKLANASCVGETSSSFLFSGVQDLGCSAWKIAGLPLFVHYTGPAQTQMDYAVKYLLSNPNTEFVTINIGGNDLGLLQLACNFDVNCELNGLPQVLANYGNNLFTIFYNIRVQAKYKGPIVLLTYYVFNYADPIQVGAFTELNGVASGIATSFGAKIADGFKAFQIATIPFGGDSCKAGLLIKVPGGTACDVHPSLEGQLLLAGTVLEEAFAGSH